MELPSLEMPVQEARKAFLEYRRAVRERHDDEDAQIMRCYRIMTRGYRIIDFREAILRGGFDPNGLPRLAMARADEKKIYLDRQQAGGCTLRPNYDGRGWHVVREAASRVWRFADGTLVSLSPEQHQQWKPITFEAIVPNIPPRFRPQHALSNYHIIFEAEWALAHPPAPRDPALLKHMGGALYAVLATWSLTPVERAVLGLTRN